MATAKKAATDKAPEPGLPVNPDAAVTPAQTNDISTGDADVVAAAKATAENATPGEEDKEAEARAKAAEEAGKATEKGELPRSTVSDHFQATAREHFGNPVVELSLRNWVGPAGLTFSLGDVDELVKVLKDLSK